MICCQYWWIFRLLTFCSHGGKHAQVKFLRCSAYICREKSLEIYLVAIGSVLVEFCHLASACWSHAGILSPSGFAGEKSQFASDPPHFVKLSTVLFCPEIFIQDQFDHAGSIGVIGRPWIDGLHGEILAHIVVLTCFG